MIVLEKYPQNNYNLSYTQITDQTINIEIKKKINIHTQLKAEKVFTIITFTLHVDL